MLKENERIIKVCSQKSNFVGFDSYSTSLFIVDNKDLSVEKDSIILLQPTLFYDNRKAMSLRFVKVLELYNNEEEFLKEYEEEDLYKLKKPFFVCNIDLEPYIQSVKECTRKIDLEKQMKKAASKLEDIAKYKALADIDPSFKPLYEEYLAICQKENQTLLEASTTENKID